MDQLRPTGSNTSANAPLPTPMIQPSQDLSELVNPTKHPSVEAKTREFVVDDMKEAPGKIKIDFSGSQTPNDWVKQPTEAAKPEPASGAQGPQFINPSPGMGTGMSAHINPQKAKEDLAGHVRVVIAIIDYGISLLAHKMYQNGTQSQYTADAQQKKLLESALVEWMFQKQIQMSAGLTLFLAFLGAYGFTILGGLKAIFDRRTNKKNIENGIITEKQNNNQPVNFVPKPHHDPNYVPPIPPSKIEQKHAQQQAQQTQQKQTVTPQQMDVFKNIQPPVTAPKPQPQLEKIYEADKSGVLHEQLRPVQQVPQFSSTWYKPDPNIIAENKKDLDAYLARGIFPMYKLTERPPIRPRKIKYGEDGKPRLAGAGAHRPKRIGK